MSHLTTLDVKLDNFEALKKAVVDMGFTYDATEHVMHTNYGQSEKVALQILSKQGKRIPLGFKQNADGTYSIRADWWDVPIQQEQFGKDVKTYHSKNKVIDVAAEKGYTLDESKWVEKDGKKVLQLTMSAWDSGSGSEGTFASNFDSQF